MAERVFKNVDFRVLGDMGPERGSRGANPLSRRMLSKYFRANEELAGGGPIISLKAIPVAKMLCIFIAIMKKGKAGAKAAAEENLVEPGSVEYIAKRMLRELVKGAGTAESKEAMGAFLEEAALIAYEFGLEEFRKREVAKFCDRLIGESRLEEAVGLAIKGLPREDVEELIAAWLDKPFVTPRIIEELRQKGFL